MKNESVGLQVEGLTIRQAGKAIIEDLSVSIAPGSLVGLIGPSGAGKSTLLRTLGLRPPSRRNRDRGIVSVFDSEKATRISGSNHQSLLEILSYVPQQDHFPEGAKAGEVLEEALTFAKQDQEIAEILKSVGLNEDFTNKPVAKISGGEKRRLSLARSLCSAPKILLLDEPTSGLDIPVALEVMELLRKLCDERGITIITTSHLPTTLATCDRVLVMEQGGKLRADHNDFASFLIKTPEAKLFEQSSPLGEIIALEHTQSNISKRDRWDFDHFTAIVKRSARQAFRDFAFARITIALPVILALLVVFTQSLHSGNAPRFINFFLTIAALWIGMSLTIREIVATRTLYAIDELSGLGKFSYFYAKASFAVVMISLSTVLLCAATWFFVWLFKIDPNAVATSDWFDSRDFISHLLILGLVCFSGSMIGLFLSTIAKSERGAISLMPLVLLPHVLFSKYATGFAGEASNDTLTHPFHSLNLEKVDYSSFTMIEQGNFWLSLLTSTRHATSSFDELGSGKIQFGQIFGIDFWVLLCLVLAQALLALIVFCYSANTAIRRIR